MLPTVLFAIQISVSTVVALFEDSPASDFNDLGKLMLAGFVAAVGVALTFTLIKLRLREKRPATSQFLSINSSDEATMRASNSTPRSVS